MSNIIVLNGDDNGDGSLRNAIEEANDDPDSTIIIDSSIENISITGEEMEITSLMTIVYDGSDNVTIARTSGTGRIFSITGGADVSMEKLVIEGGILSAGNGGAIIINSSSTLNMAYCIMQNNSAAGPSSRGGCIYIVEASSVTISNSIMQNNSSTTRGGCIYIGDFIGGSSVTMNNCIMQNNSTTATSTSSLGGCLYIIGNSSAIMNNCLAQDNSSEYAGFANIEVGATLEITLCRILNNTANSQGGAIRNNGTVTLESCTIDGNTSSGNSGAIYSQENTTIRNCTVSNNISNGFAGGIHISLIGGVSQTTIVNSTFTGNTSSTNNGGAIHIGSASGITVTIVNCTISKNTAVDGGGIYKSDGDSTLILQNTIVADNTGTHPDVSWNVDPPSPIGPPSGYNLIGDGNGSNMNNGVDGNIVGDSNTPADPKLNPLGDYGGPTQTMTLQLQNNSPAYNAGNLAYIPPDIDYDQRGLGYPRVRDDQVNIGATEGTILCYSGKSHILTKNISDNEIGITKAKDVSLDKHLVFDVTNKKFVPVRLNAITGPTNRYMLIKKNSLGKNKPDTDFYVTSGHRLVIDGVEVKARDVPQAKKVKVNNEKVYTILLDKRSVIRVNNLDVIASSYDEWISRSKKKSI